MAELSCSTGSPDPQHPLNAVLFPDRAGLLHESPADPPAVATPAPATGTAAASPVPSPRCAMRVTVTEGEPPELVHVPFIEARDPDFFAGAGTAITTELTPTSSRLSITRERTRSVS
jgi:hypothetical protein